MVLFAVLQYHLLIYIKPSIFFCMYSYLHKRICSPKYKTLCLSSWSFILLNLNPKLSKVFCISSEQETDPAFIAQGDLVLLLPLQF